MIGWLYIAAMACLFVIAVVSKWLHDRTLERHNEEVRRIYERHSQKGEAR